MFKYIAEIQKRFITNRFSCTARALFLGMLAAQVIATIQVYLSNVSLHNNITAIKDAGYLAIPNQHILNILPDFGPAFFGGIFFTLSVGAGLSLSNTVFASSGRMHCGSESSWVLPCCYFLLSCHSGCYFFRNI